MFIFGNLNQDESRPALNTSPPLLTILVMFTVLLGSCVPATQTPVSVQSTTTSQPQSTAAFIASPTPGNVNSQVSPKDGMVMVFVPAGEFKMGGTVNIVYLDAFWIDQTEVTNAMFAKFVMGTGYVTDAEKAGGSFVYRATDQGDYRELIKGAAWNHPSWENSDFSDLEDHPVVHVSWNDAQAYCAWADRRLPTEAEWEKAASWNDPAGHKYIYPWGIDFDGTRLNFCDKSCSSPWADKTVDDGYAETAPVGSYPQGTSPYGALDMAGNVSEWVADWYDAAYYRNPPLANPLGPDTGQERVLRGGTWFAKAQYATSIDRNAYDPSVSDYYVGFRCAFSPSTEILFAENRANS
jgi:serine/threonine-protein kinase